MGGNQVIYFEAETGIIRADPPAVSNFYQWRVLESHRAEIERAVAQATPDPGGLVYGNGGLGFIRQLAQWEHEARKVRNEPDTRRIP